MTSNSDKSLCAQKFLRLGDWHSFFFNQKQQMPVALKNPFNLLKIDGLAALKLTKKKMKMKVYQSISRCDITIFEDVRLSHRLYTGDRSNVRFLSALLRADERVCRE